MEQTQLKRLIIEKNKGETIVAINGKIERWQEALLLSWVVMWTALGVYVFLQLFGDYPRDNKLTFFVYLVFWAYFEFRGVHALLWRLFGQELIKITDSEILYKRDIKSYGKAIRFQRENVKNVRLNEANTKSFASVYHKSFWIVKGGDVLFDYLGKTIALGVQLEEKDARKLMKALRG